jgi:hypothetical protein
MKNNHWITRIFPIFITALLLLSACAAQSAASPDVYQESMAEAPSAAPAEGGVAFDSSARTFNAPDQQQVERIVIKNGSLSIVVDDPAASMDNVSRLADELGGFVVSANMFHTTLESGAEVPQASITIRVPVEKLNDALDRIKAESTQTPLSENLTSQDVTSEFTDLESRLRNLEAAEEQLSEIMGSAVRTEDVLNVYNQLVQVREQIEVIKGQIKYYRESADLSAISVELIANAAVQPLTVGGWQPVGVAKDAVQALINMLKFLANAVIWMVILILPTLALIYVIFFLPLRFLWRWLRRQGKSKKAPPAAPAA